MYTVLVLSLEPAAAALVGVIILQEPTDAVRWIAIALLITASTWDYDIARSGGTPGP